MTFEAKFREAFDCIVCEFFVCFDVMEFLVLPVRCDMNSVCMTEQSSSPSLKSSLQLCSWPRLSTKSRLNEQATSMREPKWREIITKCINLISHTMSAFLDSLYFGVMSGESVGVSKSSGDKKMNSAPSR
jgi:hypothetical protein